MVRYAIAVRAAALGALLGLASSLALAQSEPAVALGGDGIRPATITKASLEAMPATELDISFMSSKGERHGHYTGVLLWTLLEEAGILEGGGGHHDELRRTFTVTGSDGYAIVFSVGEVMPDFGNRAMILAYAVDGGPLPPDEGIRLIVPGDARGARSVSDVVSIDVK